MSEYYSSNTERIPKIAVELATVGIVDPWTVSFSKQRQSSSESRGNMETLYF